jgi:hypothetical protein
MKPLPQVSLCQPGVHCRADNTAEHSVAACAVEKGRWLPHALWSTGCRGDRRRQFPKAGGKQGTIAGQKNAARHRHGRELGRTRYGAAGLPDGGGSWRPLPPIELQVGISGRGAGRDQHRCVPPPARTSSHGGACRPAPRRSPSPIP